MDRMNRLHITVTGIRALNQKLLSCFFLVEDSEHIYLAAELCIPFFVFIPAPFEDTFRTID